MQAEAAKSSAALRGIGKAATASTAEANAAQASLSKRLTSTGASFSTFGRNWNKYVALPIAALGALAVKTSLDFHHSMELIQTQAGATGKEVDRMTGAIERMAASGKFEQGPNDLATALFHVESAGYRGAKAMKVLRASANLAAVGHANLEDTTNALVGAMKTGIKGTHSMNTAIGILNASVGAGNLRMEDLTAAMGTGFLGSARQVGLSLKDVGAALAELTAQGVPAATAATRLRTTFSLLAAPTDKAKSLLEGIGIDATDMATTMRQPNGLLKALELLHSHLDGLSKVEQTQLLSGAFGGSRSGTTIMTLVNNLGDLSDKYTAINQGQSDFNQKLKETRADPVFKLQAAWAKIQVSLVKIGDALIPVIAPALSDAANTLSKIADWFNALPDPVKKVAVDAALIATSLGLAAKAVGFMLKASGILAGSKFLGKLIGIGGGAAAAETAVAGGAAAETVAGAGAGTAAAEGAAVAGGVTVGTAAAVAIPVTLVGVGIAAAFLSDDNRFKTELQAIAHKRGQQISDALVAGIDAEVGAGHGMESVTDKILQQIQQVGTKIQEVPGIGGPRGLAGPEFEQARSAVARTIDDMKQRYGSLVSAGHDMSAKQRKAWIDIALNARRNGDITAHQLFQLTNAFTNNTSQWKTEMHDAAQVTGQTTHSIARSVGDASVHVSKTYDGMVRVVGGGLNWLTSNTSKAAQALGVKQEVKFHATPAAMHGPIGTRAGLAQGGAIVPGNQLGDHVPLYIGGRHAADVESQEGVFVVNRNAMAFLRAVNESVPRQLAGGGAVKLLPGVNMSYGSEPTILRDLGAFSGEMGKTVYVISGYRSPAHSVAVGGFANDPHTRGEAADIGLGAPTLDSMLSLGLEGPLNRVGLHRPYYPPSTKEANHVELLNAAAQGKLGAPAQQIARLILHGPDGSLRLRDTGQASLDDVWHASKRYLARKARQMAATVGTTGLGPNVATGPIVQMAHEMVVKEWDQGQWPPFQTLEMHEAGWNPHATNPRSGAYGIPQAYPASKLPSGAGPGSTLPLLDQAKLQLRWMIGYIKATYGTPAAAWAQYYNHAGGVGSYQHGGELKLNGGGGFVDLWGTGLAELSPVGEHGGYADFRRFLRRRGIRRRHREEIIHNLRHHRHQESRRDRRLVRDFFGGKQYAQEGGLIDLAHLQGGGMAGPGGGRGGAGPHGRGDKGHVAPHLLRKYHLSRSLLREARGIGGIEDALSGYLSMRHYLSRLEHRYPHAYRRSARRVDELKQREREIQKQIEDLGSAQMIKKLGKHKAKQRQRSLAHQRSELERRAARVKGRPHNLREQMAGALALEREFGHEVSGAAGLERSQASAYDTFLGYFRNGGVLPRDGLYYGHRGERVVEGSSSSEPHVEVNVFNDPSSWEQMVEVKIDGKLAKYVRTGGSGPAPGAKSTTLARRS